MTEFDDIEILLVEDNRQDAEMTIRALKKCSILNKLYWAKDGVEALDFVHCQGAYAERDPNQVPKLILLDLKMPRLDGLDVLRALKSDQKTRQIPIVAMTSSNQERDVTESYRLGVNGYVTKPVQFAAFMEAVANVGMYWLFVNQTRT
jgi:two-component system response regulator